MSAWMSHISSGRQRKDRQRARERKQGMPVERGGCRQAARERAAGWSVACAHGGRWVKKGGQGGAMEQEVEG